MAPPIIRDDMYPLQSLHEHLLTLDPDGSLLLPTNITENVLLLVQFRATGREPRIQISTPNGQSIQQFFEPNSAGSRYLNLTGFAAHNQTLIVHPQDCHIEREVTLLQFPQIKFDDGPLLIVAPHADDAELAAYGLYRHHAERCWIVTVSAGEKLQSLKRQYVPGLDQNIDQAELRKGLLRAWNSATTPLLAGVSANRLIMLGYFNMTLHQMMTDLNSVVPHPSGLQATPTNFRRFNQFPLPSDSDVKNRGEDLISDLMTLIAYIRPATIVVTHPELDPHSDHIATTKAVAIALDRLSYYPKEVLLYANHYKGIKGFPYGPEHSGTTLPPAQVRNSSLGTWRVHSEYLSLAVQKEKVMVLDTMHDLRHQLRPERRFKQWITQLRRKCRYRYYGAHPYFQTAIKAHEVFSVITGEAFVNGMVAHSPLDAE